jgi:chromate transporter
VLRLFFLVISLTAVSFGGAQILLAGLERELVQTGQIGEPEFAAAVALGQSTPGPLAAFTTAVGMAVGGLPGAVVATVALLMVSLVVVWLIQQIPAALLRHPRIQAGLSGLPPLGVSLVIFLVVHMLLEQGAPKALGAAVITGVLAGRLLQVPTGWLLGGAVLVSILVA